MAAIAPENLFAPMAIVCSKTLGVLPFEEKDAARVLQFCEVVRYEIDPQYVLMFAWKNDGSAIKYCRGKGTFTANGVYIIAAKKAARYQYQKPVTSVD